MNGVSLVRCKNTFSALMVVRGLLLELECYTVQVLFVLLKLTLSWDGIGTYADTRQTIARVMLLRLGEFEKKKAQQVYLEILQLEE